MFKQIFPATANQAATFTWDGQDAYDRLLQGRQPAIVRIGYVYDPVYEAVPRFGYYGNGIPIEVNARDEVILYQVHQTSLGAFDMRSIELGGWNISEHHVYDPVGRVLYLGDGNRRDLANLIQAGIIETVAGTGGAAFGGDGGPASQAMLAQPRGLATGTDGSLYIADTANERVRKIDPNGIITTIAGTGVAGYNGDNILATQAQLNSPTRVQVGRDGSIYISDRLNFRIRRIDPDGVITTVAGNGMRGFSGDDGPATQARIGLDAQAFLAPDGSLYIADNENHRVRRVHTDGVITTVAGTGVAGFTGDGIPATQSRLNGAFDIVIGDDGSFYASENGSNRIRRIGPDGIITTFAGGGSSNNDGIAATQANLAIHGLGKGSMAAGPDGSIYVATDFARIRRISPDGIITTVAGGSGFSPNSGDGGPALQAQFPSVPDGLAIGPDGSLHIATAVTSHRVPPGIPPTAGVHDSRYSHRLGK